jgi:hypothetical protein
MWDILIGYSNSIGIAIGQKSTGLRLDALEAAAPLSNRNWPAGSNEGPTQRGGGVISNMKNITCKKSKTHSKNSKTKLE